MKSYDNPVDGVKSWHFRYSGISTFLFSSLSIASLLLYFQGIASFARLALTLLAIEAIGLFGVALWARAKGLKEQGRVIASGLFAGSLATLAYDIVRVPIAHSGIPVFKAISYFGTVLVGVQAPTPFSEAVGWAYHLSNGVSFGLMYAAVVRRPGPISAVLWGLALEGAMLLTPYAEVFGYRRDAKFLAITIGAHAVYGLVLWLALRPGTGAEFRMTARKVAIGFLGAPLALAGIAADFYGRYASHLPASPPPYIGPHLYTTWDVPEPDRIVAMWVMRRHVDGEAKFHFIPPFEAIRYGRPFDLPEAEIRRHGLQSATEFLLAQRGLESDAKLTQLARMTHLNEITPWMLASDPEAGRLTEALRARADQACGKALSNGCMDQLFSFLDTWSPEAQTN